MREGQVALLANADPVRHRLGRGAERERQRTASNDFIMDDEEIRRRRTVAGAHGAGRSWCRQKSASYAREEPTAPAEERRAEQDAPFEEGAKRSGGQGVAAKEEGQ